MARHDAALLRDAVERAVYLGRHGRHRPQHVRETASLMLRVLLEPALLFALPFAVYILYMSVRQRYPFAVEAWSHSRVASLALAGLAVAVAGDRQSRQRQTGDPAVR